MTYIPTAAETLILQFLHEHNDFTVKQLYAAFDSAVMHRAIEGCAAKGFIVYAADGIVRITDQVQ